MSLEVIESRHKKELKALEGEKRAAIKKDKGTKGKKAKESVSNVEDEYASKLKQTMERHQKELRENDGGQEEKDEIPTIKTETPAAPAPTTTGEGDKKQVPEEQGLSEKERKQIKARLKKERQREREAQRQAESELEAANAGPSLRQVEEEQIQAVLGLLNLKISEVEADGHCLYRAVAAQTNKTHTEIRESCQKKAIIACMPFFMSNNPWYRV
jgi:OTU domain-containing protein 6